jgi:hypothetical protein
MGIGLRKWHARRHRPIEGCAVLIEAADRSMPSPCRAAALHVGKKLVRAGKRQMHLLSLWISRVLSDVPTISRLGMELFRQRASNGGTSRHCSDLIWLKRLCSVQGLNSLTPRGGSQGIIPKRFRAT